MTRDEARDFAKIVQAYADGKAVQMYTANGWRDIHEDPCFDSGFESYRIKPEPPEPREWCLRALPDGRIAVFTLKDQAQTEATFWENSKVIHVREVMP